ncbi:hypothetical protein [Streptomyces sp. ISL-100]|uniref:hypothetical protein n=1 Tax=Streptomyces sp. ISL-100 TaxID=2819173 RepID=UPI001BE8FD09|nr:hypothetical protein [Streptomyces sp. ISL-100]MBT2394934.1 hypothetical protein [Streptomyces sp. ISL-100]
MLSPPYDAHVTLLAVDAGTLAQVRPGTVIPDPAPAARIKTYIQERDVGRPGRVRRPAR